MVAKTIIEAMLLLSDAKVEAEEQEKALQQTRWRADQAEAELANLRLELEDKDQQLIEARQTIAALHAGSGSVQ